MKILRFDALKMEVPVSDNSVYFDLGYVESIEETEKFLYWKHEQDFVPYKNKNKNIITTGRCDYFVTNGLKYAYIFYLKQNDNWTEIRTRAHEETHVMQHFNCLIYLQKKMNEKRFEINLFDWDNETQAYMGGWFSLVMWNQKLKANGSYFNHLDKMAYEKLSESRVKDGFFRKIYKVFDEYGRR